MPLNDEQYLRRAIELARKARENGDHPFGALLVDAEGKVLLEALNSVNTERDCTGHAETNLMRMASKHYERDFLETCSLYTSTEPCAMCAGAIYWGHVGRVVFALSEKHLRDMTGDDPQNPSFSLPCREVFAHGQRQIEVVGPMIEKEARVVHAGFWKPL